MLYQITNHCSLVCKHCMVDAKPNDRHASRTTTVRLMKFIRKYGVRVLVISGGEPTEHPNLIWHVEKLTKEFRKLYFIIGTNGNLFKNKNLMKRLARIKNLGIQVSAIPEFYSNYEETNRLYKKYSANFETIDLISDIKILDTIGRAKRLYIDNYDKCRKTTNCINTFLIARQVSNLKELIRALEESSFGFCKPMIDYQGYIYAGESLDCVKIGSIFDDGEKIFSNILNKFPCLKCKENK